MTIEFEDRVVQVLAKLRAQAAARQMSLDAYLEQFVEHANVNASVEEFDRVLDELPAMPAAPGSLPADFSRAGVYLDHD